MKRKFNYLITIVIYLAIYPLLFLLLGLSTLVIILPRLNDTAGELTARPTGRLAGIAGEPSARPTYRLATLPTTAPITTPTSHPAGSAPGPEVASPAAVNASAPAVEVAAVADSAVLPSAGSSNTASSPASAANSATAPAALASTPDGGSAAAVGPVQPPAIPAATAVVANATQAAPVQPAASPTATPAQAATPAQIQSSTSSNTSPVATPRPAQPPRATPTPTLTPVPDYDYMLAEFFNSPTTNAFMVMYVAVVDPREIPIGDMKVVGTRLDKNETYESPLTQWHYSGSSAPGEFIKTGNTKFEPPQAMETTAWVLHLEDAHGNRQSADVPFDVDANDKQWYFIKFRRKY